MRKALRLVVGGLLLPLIAAAQEPDRKIQQQLDVTQKLLERTTQDHEQCRRDWADIWVQARQLSMAYQQLHQEMQALKDTQAQETPPAAGQEKKLPENGATP